MAQSSVYLVILYLCLNGYIDLSIGYEKNSTNEWDYLIFTQQWPPAACLNWRNSNPNNTCYINSQIDSWTVHGIWPSLKNSSDPSFCNKSNPFDVNQIQSIKGELHKYWPNVHAKTPDDKLWTHEWDKHGTCATSLPKLGTQLKYFQQGLEWIKQYNMYNILTNSGIEPSVDSPVLINKIETAVNKALNVKPLLNCEYIEKNNTYHIFEIKVCFDKGLELIDCPDSKAKPRCNANFWVWYPPLHTKKEKDIIEPTSGMDSGDVLALLLGLLISTMGFFACLGSYARKQRQ